MKRIITDNHILGLAVFAVALILETVLIFRNASFFQIATLLIVFSVIGFIVYKLDEINLFKISYEKFLLEFSSIRDEIYAKADEVRKIEGKIEKIAKLMYEMIFISIDPRTRFGKNDKANIRLEKSVRKFVSLLSNKEKERDKWWADFLDEIGIKQNK